MNAAVKMVSSSVQMDITASSKVSYNRRKIDMLQGSIFLRLAIWNGPIQLKVVNGNHGRPYANEMF